MRPFIRTIEDTEFDGGTLCLDFVNTVRNRYEEPLYDYLLGPEEWLVWIKRQKLISRSNLATLIKKTQRKNKSVKRDFNKIMKIREDFYEFFRSISKGKNPGRLIENRVSKHISYCFSHINIEVAKRRVVKEQFSIDNNQFLLPLLTVIKSGYDLMVSENLDRVKECANCGWLFLDKSKNNSRKWCNMNTCGSSDKARRYYLKIKSERT